MHPRNKYFRNAPNFRALADLYPDVLGRFVIQKCAGSAHSSVVSVPADARIGVCGAVSKQELGGTAKADGGGGSGKKRKRNHPEALEPCEESCNRDANFDESTRPASDGKQPRASSWTIDWRDPAALRALTQTLLLHDFGLRWDIPANRLCPTVTNRLNYIHWIEDLLEVGKNTKISSDSRSASVWGLDVGTGASCIYPLLGCKLHKDWKFWCTEIDSESIASAQRNVLRNQLQDRIHCVRAKERSDIFDPIFSQESAPPLFSFSMCNPPFFEEGHNLPSTTATGQSAQPTETHARGGEVAFVLRMYEESAKFPLRTVWYTTMFGKKSNFRRFLRILTRQGGPRRVEKSTLVQGRLRRWVVAWSFLPQPQDAAARASAKISDGGFVVDRKGTTCANQQNWDLGDGSMIRRNKPVGNRRSRNFSVELDRRALKSESPFRIVSDRLHQCCSTLISGEAFGESQRFPDLKCTVQNLSSAELISEDHNLRFTFEFSIESHSAAQPDNPNSLRIHVIMTWNHGVGSNASSAKIAQRVERDIRRSGRWWRRRLARSDDANVRNVNK